MNQRAIVSVSNDKTEWYDRVITCKMCNFTFMIDSIDDDFTNIVGLCCPKCRRTIIGVDTGVETIFKFRKVAQNEFSTEV